MSYETDLENLIMDELMPMYLVGCRSSNVPVNQNKIISRLLEIRRSRKVLPALLDKGFSEKSES